MAVGFSIAAQRRFAVQRLPVVSGHIVARTPIREYSVPRVDFTIQIDGTDTQVHARMQRKYMNEVPNVVRFHWSGNASREVFLFEYEENPYWCALLCWAATLALSLPLLYVRIRNWLGWEW
jgi:hypothetical protein